jgi:hypothetical protein
MKSRAWSSVVLVCGLAASAGFLASAARADGLPVLGVGVGGSGVASAAGDARYVTLPAGRGTVVARVSPAGGRVLGSRVLRGSFTIPAVAYDGSASGLSADGRILVLIEPRQSFPRAKTTFTVLSAPRLRPLRVVRLHGDTLTVSHRNSDQVVVDTRSYQASTVLARPISSQKVGHRDGRTIPWTLIALSSISALVLLATLTITLRRRQRPVIAQ